MTAIRNVQIIPLDPPYGGLNDRVPTSALQSPDCERISNFNIANTKIALRHGDKYFSQASSASSAASTLVSFRDNTGTTNVLLFMTQINGVDINWYGSVGGSAFAFNHQITGKTTVRAHTNIFNNKIFFWDEGGTFATVTQGASYDMPGGTWTHTPYTFTAGFVPVLGSSYNRRQYIVKYQSYVYTYSRVDSISGPTTDPGTGVTNDVDLSSIFNTQGVLFGIRSVSSADVVQAQKFQCFLGSSGDILAYTGSYPGSSDWSLSGQFKVAPLLCYESLIDYRGDALLLTTAGIFSVRDLLLKGSQTSELTAITYKISNRWIQIIKGIAAVSLLTKIQGVWDSTNNRLIVSFPAYVDRDTGVAVSGNFFMVYDITNQAWFEHVGLLFPNTGYRNVYGMARDQDHVYYYGDLSTSGTTVWLKEEKANFKDDNTIGTLDFLYPFNIRSAPLPLPKSGVARVVGFEAITKGDYYVATDFKLIADMGRQTTGMTRVPDQGTAVLKPLVNLGVEGTYVQWDLNNDGTTTWPATVGCEIYGINALFEQGGLR